MTDNFDKNAVLYNNVFNKNQDGILVLDDLWTRFYDIPHKTPLNELDLAFQAGQRSVIRYMQLQRDKIERQIQQEDKE